MPLKYMTAGESHGKGLVGIIEGIPAGLKLAEADINPDLKRRQGGYGRGGRMKIESDAVEFFTGVRWGETFGAPITLIVHNRDFKNWEKGMASSAQDSGSIDAVTRPRPGHADLPGVIKYNRDDIRDILERSSARETAMRVAVGGLCKKFLSAFGVFVGSFVLEVGRVGIAAQDTHSPKALRALHDKAEGSEMRCPDETATKEMMAHIDEAKATGDTLGGVFTVFATGLPVGLGGHVQWDSRLEGKLAQALMSIQAIKGVEVGMGFDAARTFGSNVMDALDIDQDGAISKRLGRATNNAGGIEGGMTNGQPLVVKAAMKPIPTLKRPLKSMDIKTSEITEATYERSDTCAVPAASVVGEAMVAITLAGAFIEKFGGDSMQEVLRNYNSYMDYVRGF